MGQLIDILNTASEVVDENKKNLDFALEQLERKPEIEKPLGKLLSLIAPDYLIKLIEIIDKAGSKP